MVVVVALTVALVRLPLVSYPKVVAPAGGDAQALVLA
jgi:hypothetical protein